MYIKTLFLFENNNSKMKLEFLRCLHTLNTQIVKNFKNNLKKCIGYSLWLKKSLP